MKRERERGGGGGGLKGSAHFALQILVILTLSYTHSLLSPCFSFFLSFSFFSFFGLVAHTQSLDIGDSRRGASMALAFSSTPLAPTELEDATTLSPSTLVTRRRDRHSVRAFETSNQSLDGFFFFFFSLLFNHGYSQIEHRSHC